MKNSYIYPLSSRDSTLGLYNPYIDDLIESCGRFINFINYEQPSKIGIFDILRYIFKLDYIFFNWIEKLPENKAGKIQTIFLIMIFPIFKILKIKIVWTMHNKLSHSLEHEYWKKVIFKKMLKYSDIILTHSSEGITYGNEIVTGSEKKIHFFHHPIKDKRLSKKLTKENDLLVWGTISPYKGVDKFLEYIYQNKLDKKYKILIVGKITSVEYQKKLDQYKSEKILIENKFIEDALLQELIAKSKHVLFTYSQASILSSGVLMDSLGYGANIIGPNTGAFADLAKEGIINTYTDFQEMFQIIDEQLNDLSKIIPEKRSNLFLEENSWNKFAENLSILLK